MLKDLICLYTTRLNQLGLTVDKKVNSTDFKHRILLNIPDIQAHAQGKYIILAFESDIGQAIKRACDKSCDSEALILAKAANIVRKELFEMRASAEEFNGTFSDDCQSSSVPPSLTALVSMVHEGPSIKNQTREEPSPSSLAVSQLIAFNTVKRKRDKTASYRHSRSQETPFRYTWDFFSMHIPGKENSSKNCPTWVLVNLMTEFYAYQLTWQMGSVNASTMTVLCVRQIFVVTCLLQQP